MNPDGTAPQLTESLQLTDMQGYNTIQTLDGSGLAHTTS